MKNNFLSLLSIAILLKAACCFAETTNIVVNDAAQGPLAKTRALETLKKARETQEEDLAKLDQELKAKIAETSSFQVVANNPSSERAIENRWSNLNESLRLLGAKRSEALARQKLLNQIMFDIDTKWNGQNMRSFLEHSFLDMSLSEMTDENPDSQRAVFYTYLSVAVREIPEKTDDLISFLIGYVNFSSISKPKAPLAYTNTRNYSNGSKSQAARAAKTETISQLVEKRLKIVEEMRTSSMKGERDSADSDHTQKDEEDFDESKVIRAKDSEKGKPSAQVIINFAPNRVSEVLLKD